MTLILNSISHDFILVVSDRLLTYPDGSVHSDHAMKAITVSCVDAHFVIGYTGLAYLDKYLKLRTDYWIVDQLQEAAHLSLGQIIIDLKEKLEKAFSKQSLPNGFSNAITISLSGYLHTSPFYVSLSNQEDEKGNLLQSISEEFIVKRTLWRAKNSYKRLNIAVIGCEKAIAKDTNAYKALMRFRRWHFKTSPESRCNALVSVLREAASHPTHGKFIGKDCVASIIYPETNVISYYYPELESPFIVAPHYVTANCSFRDIAVLIGNATFEEFSDYVKRGT
ncbi:MAG TPA: hypothetical protein VGD04_01040 [Methylophilus sp.]